MWIDRLTASLIVWVGCLPRTSSDLRQQIADARGVLEAVPTVPRATTTRGWLGQSADNELVVGGNR